MDSTPVNWETLDTLVIEFAKSENLIEEHRDPPSPLASLSSPSSSASSSSYQSRLLIRQIRHSLQVGDIDTALDLIRVHAPFILDDHRILFRLHKQKFIELLRKGTDKDRDSAVDCLRNALAPSALDAYPEAYEEFKHVLLAFIYDKDDQSSPVANEWSEKRRFEIAGLMSSVLRAHLHAYDPVFSMTLRYLISIHKGFCLREGISSPISDLNERLLLEERDLPATPQESLYGAPPFDEVDIQALAHAVELTRQGAIDSLRFAKGNLFQAFQNELCRMQLDVPLLDELIREYCVYRGIVDSGFGSPYEMEAPSRLLKVEQPENGDCSSWNSSIVVDYRAAKHSEDETSVIESHVTDEKNVDASSSPATDVELRYPREPTDHHDDSSTSETSQFEHMKIAHRNRSYRTGERNRRKRWKGRHDQLDFTLNVNLCGNKRQELVPAIQEACRTLSKDQQDMEKYEIVLGMKELASKGMAAEVVEEVNVIDPNFFVQNPTLLFQLKQVEFLKFVKSGDHSGALKVACSHLGPLAAKDPALLKPLKETLLTFLRPSEETHGTGLPLHALASSLQVALGRRFGIEEPQLMKIMRATIHTHSEWFKLHKCKDHFEGLLKIDSLKDVNTPMITHSTLKSNADSSVYGSSQVTESSTNRMAEDSSSPTPESSGDIMCDENAILKVMEFLALPRADAIHLLAQYNGNAETVIQQMFV